MCVVTPISAGRSLLSTTMVVRITNLLFTHGLIPIPDNHVNGAMSIRDYIREILLIS